MNPRIKELAKQAGYGQTDDPYVRQAFDVNLFAESLVRECINIATGLSELYTRDDVGFDVGYTMGTKRVAKEIAESFGIKE
jgi:hypothetical protein